ncbi:MAG: ABC transporter ATP-binding protein, partial [Thermoplasmata archaeon]|nr:ABC transporter ATP-binding protein [Thermoplasmata archaeon]
MRGVTVRFGARAALQEVDFSAGRGEFVALAGPNGSGKTTLLRALLGFVTPDAGEVELFGAPVPELSVRERARRVAWVPQEESPRDNVPILDYVLYGRYAHLGPLEGESDEDRRFALQVLQDVGLADRAMDGVLSISGGERQRAILARALAQETPVLLLDEPTAHLDIGHQLDLLERVRQLSRQRGVTVIAALHDLNLAARFADRIFVLSRGRRYADGPPSEVISEDLLGRVWGVVADLRRDPRTGAPYLMPHRVIIAVPPGATPPSLGPVHVVGGGGAGSPYLRALSDGGFRLTTGALHLLDSDSETADTLGIPTVVEIPFAPLGDEVRARNRELMGAARAIVVTPFAVGPSNLANLEDLVPLVGRTPMFVVSRPTTPEWDFTGGRATALWETLIRGGAQEVSGSESLLVDLRVVLGSPSG